jgi:FtsH-binding integral membrane protein
MQRFSTSSSQPLAISASTESQVYLLFSLAIALTVIGVIGGMAALPMLSSGLLMICLFAELGIIFTAGLWTHVKPVNYLLFALFPLLSGFTFTPYIINILGNYANGAEILLNALISTTLMGCACAVFARTTGRNLSWMGQALFFGLLGLLFFSLIQIFFPALRTTGIEMVVSGFGILLFAGFTAYDIQRIQHLGKVGMNPFMMAISLYLDIFNLFLYILRFMLMISGQRR